MPHVATEWTRLGLLLAWLLAPGAMQAAGPLQGELRFAATRDEPVWVGEQVELQLELWTDGFSFGDQQFVLPAVPGGYLLQGDATTVKLSETRAGVAWQGLRYTLLLYPQRVGRLEVPPFDVSFSARAGFGSAPASFEFRTAPVFVEARLPQGAEQGALTVSTTRFSLEAHWDRSVPAEGPLRLQVGDALTLEVTRRADDVPGMLFAPLPVPRIEGLGAYPDAAVVNDRVNRGELSGERTDRVTFVCETAGAFVIPEWRFQWWDPQRQRLSDKVLPALHLEVRPHPAYGGSPGESTAPGQDEGYTRLFLMLLLLLVLGAAARRLAAPLWQRLHGRKRRNLPPAVGPQPRTGRLLSLNPRGSDQKPGSGRKWTNQGRDASVPGGTS